MLVRAPVERVTRAAGGGARAAATGVRCKEVDVAARRCVISDAGATVTFVGGGGGERGRPPLVRDDDDDAASANPAAGAPPIPSPSGGGPSSDGRALIATGALAPSVQLAYLS